jgi:hypothetical protein
VFPDPDALFSFNVEPLRSVRERCDIVLDRVLRPGKPHK